VLARHTNLAERTLIRRFQATTGTTPIKWLTEQRVLRARELLESSTLPVEHVARQCGLGAAANFRRHFSMTVGVSPSVYRRAFATTRGERVLRAGMLRADYRSATSD
jgi:AraC family transcriptional regulator, transcriptional activator FtrA